MGRKESDMTERHTHTHTIPPTPPPVPEELDRRLLKVKAEAEIAT